MHLVEWKFLGQLVIEFLPDVVVTLNEKLLERRLTLILHELVGRVVCTDHFVAENLAMSSQHIRRSSLRAQNDRSAGHILKTVAAGNSRIATFDSAMALLL